MTLKTTLAAFAIAALAGAAQAQSFKLGGLEIGHPYARPTAPGQSTGVGYLRLANGGPDDKLVSIATAVSTRVELHSMSMEGDVMRMRQIDGIALPAGRTVELEPGGLHLMFIGLKAPLKAGTKFALKLGFEKAGEIEVTVNVRAPGAAAASAAAHRH